MSQFPSDEWPPPSFRVFSRSGKYVGYAFQDDTCFEVYPPGGEDEGWRGWIEGSEVRFSSDELAGYVRENRIFFYDGTEVGHVEHQRVMCKDGAIAGWVEGTALPEAVGGAILLLIINRWFRSDGSVNEDVA